MRPTDYVINLALSVFVIFGMYQFYFYCQRHPWRKIRTLPWGFDRAFVPYWPCWVWVYTGLYFPIILCANLAVTTPRQFGLMAASYVVLLFAQMGFFLAFPVTLPKSWRILNKRRNVSEQFLAFIGRIDNESNCFPSMHCSVSMLTALHLRPLVGGFVWIIPALISLSCVFTKQHYVLDVPAGLALGWAIFELCRILG